MHTTRIKIRAIPSSPKTQVIEVYGDTIKIRIAAPPEKGKANKALLKFLKKRLNAESVTLIAGEGTRDKTVEIISEHMIGNSPQQWLEALK